MHLRLPIGALAIFVLCSIRECTSRRVDIDVDDLSTDIERDHEEVQHPLDELNLSRNVSASPAFEHPAALESIGTETMVTALKSAPFAAVDVNRTPLAGSATALAKNDSTSLAEQSQALEHNGNRIMHFQWRGLSQMFDSLGRDHLARFPAAGSTGTTLCSVLVGILLILCCCSICIGVVETHLKAQERLQQKQTDAENQRDRIRRDRWQKVRKSLVKSPDEQFEGLHSSDQHGQSSGTESNRKGWGKLKGIVGKAKGKDKYLNPKLSQNTLGHSDNEDKGWLSDAALYERNAGRLKAALAKDHLEKSDNEDKGWHSDTTAAKERNCSKLRAVLANCKNEPGADDDEKHKAGDLTRGIIAAFRKKHKEAAQRVTAKKEENAERD